MNLRITPKAQKIIAEKGNNVTIRLEEHICYSWGGAQSRDIPSVRWGLPESSEIGEYEKVDIDGASIYIHNAVGGAGNARIDAVTGGVGTKLILLGLAGHK